MFWNHLNEQTDTQKSVVSDQPKREELLDDGPKRSRDSESNGRSNAGEKQRASLHQLNCNICGGGVLEVVVDSADSNHQLA